MTNSLLTKEEIALHFRVSTQTIRRWTKAGILSPIRVGKKVLYDRASLANQTVELNKIA